MILIGAAVGAISYTISEAISYSLINKWSWPWEQFAGSIVGGAVGGVIGGILGACKFVAPIVGFSSGFVATAVGMNLQNEFERTNYSTQRILGMSVVSELVSGALALVPPIGIPGITMGRNSFSAIALSITKKYVRGTVRNMALRTMGRMFTYNLATSHPALSDRALCLDQEKDALSLPLRSAHVCLRCSWRCLQGTQLLGLDGGKQNASVRKRQYQSKADACQNDMYSSN